MEAKYIRDVQEIKLTLAFWEPQKGWRCETLRDVDQCGSAGVGLGSEPTWPEQRKRSDSSCTSLPHGERNAPVPCSPSILSQLRCWRRGCRKGDTGWCGERRGRVSCEVHTWEAQVTNHRPMQHFLSPHTFPPQQWRPSYQNSFDPVHQVELLTKI